MRWIQTRFIYPDANVPIQSKKMSSTTTYHTLHRTWPSQANPSGQAEERQPIPMSANMKFSLERWAGESMREQPWNGVGQFAEQRNAERHHVGGEEGSNGGEVGSERKV